MKITYTPNPLRTVIELDPHEQKELWYKLKIESLVERLFSVHYELTYKKEGPDLARVAKEVDPSYYWSDDGKGNRGKGKLDARCDEALADHLQELRGCHVGDCTCCACSCAKCHAESLLGIDTIKGLGKHPGHKIASAFAYKDGDEWKERTLAEALASLRNYDPKPSSAWANVGGFISHVPRWKAEAADALKWLESYAAEHFQEQV